MIAFGDLVVARSQLMRAIQDAWMRRCASIVGLMACWLLYAPLHASAGPLGLNTTSPGDVTSFSTDVEYNHTTGVLTANSTSDGNAFSALDDNGYFYPATLAVTANLNPANGALLSGTVSLTGTEYYTVDNSPLLNDGNDGVLLTGNLIAFGFPNPTNSTNVPLEFEFSLTGGLLTAPGEPYAPSPYYIVDGGMILHMISTTPFFTGSWPTGDFGSQGSNNALNTSSDTFPVLIPTPEPSTFVLLALGFLPLAWSLRRRSRHPA
jgi:hypothetical protein